MSKARSRQCECCKTLCSENTKLHCPGNTWHEKETALAEQKALKVGDWVVHVWEEEQTSGTVECQWEGYVIHRSLDGKQSVNYTNFGSDEDTRHMVGELPLDREIGVTKKLMTRPACFSQTLGKSGKRKAKDCTRSTAKRVKKESSAVRTVIKEESEDEDDDVSAAPVTLTQQRAASVNNEDALALTDMPMLGSPERASDAEEDEDEDEQSSLGADTPYAFKDTSNKWFDRVWDGKKLMSAQCKVPNCSVGSNGGKFLRQQSDDKDGGNKTISSGMRRHQKEHAKAMRKADIAAAAAAAAAAPANANTATVPATPGTATPVSLATPPANNSTPQTHDAPQPSRYGFGCSTYVQLLAYLFAAYSLPFSLLDSASPFRVVLAYGHELKGLNMFPRQIAEQIDVMADLTRNDLYAKLRGKDVSLLMDGATVMRRSFLGFAICDGDNSYFLDCVELKHGSSSPALQAHIEQLVRLLLSKDIRVFSLVADNAPNIQRAIRETQSLNSQWQVISETGGDSDPDSDSDSDDETVSSDTNAPDIGEVITSVFDSLENSGILRYRCSVHGLQLVLKDFTAFASVSQFKDTATAMITKYEKPSQWRTTLETNQTDAGKAKPLRVKRFTSVRWNSLYDSVKTLVELRPYMVESDKNNVNFWRFADFFLVVCQPITTLSDVLQANNSPMFTYAAAVRTLLTTYKDVLTAAAQEYGHEDECNGMWTAVNERCAKHLVYDGVKMMMFLNPSIDHANVDGDTLRRNGALVVKYAVAHALRRGVVGTEQELKELVEGEIDHFYLMGRSRHHTIDNFWKSWRLAAVMPILHGFVAALSMSSHSEATVERHFKALSAVLNKRRGSLASERVANALMLSQTHRELNRHCGDFKKHFDARDKREQSRQKIADNPSQPPVNRELGFSQMSSLTADQD